MFYPTNTACQWLPSFTSTAAALHHGTQSEYVQHSVKPWFFPTTGNSYSRARELWPHAFYRDKDPGCSVPPQLPGVCHRLLQGNSQRDRGSTGGRIIILMQERSKGWILESMRFQGPNMVICEDSFRIPTNAAYWDIPETIKTRSLTRGSGGSEPFPGYVTLCPGVPKHGNRPLK